MVELTALASRNGRAIATFLKFYGTVQQIFKEMVRSIIFSL